jgi:hypothetical protein
MARRIDKGDGDGSSASDPTLLGSKEIPEPTFCVPAHARQTSRSNPLLGKFAHLLFQADTASTIPRGGRHPVHDLAPSMGSSSLDQRPGAPVT